MDLYTCTECGRCQAVCPAHAAGQPLSPKMVILKLRDALNERMADGTWQQTDGVAALAGGLSAKKNYGLAQHVGPAKRLARYLSSMFRKSLVFDLPC